MVDIHYFITKLANLRPTTFVPLRPNLSEYDAVYLNSNLHAYN